MISTTATHEQGGAAFLDFKAAFPSISQGLMHNVLAELGVPHPILCMLQVSYTRISCELVVGAHRHRGFALTPGIR